MFFCEIFINPDQGRSKYLTIYEELKELTDIISANDDLGKIDSIYQIRYVVLDGNFWAVDSNRKLFIARQVERLFGLVFTCIDVTNCYAMPNELIDDIDDMIQRHNDGSIYLPTFSPYVVYADRAERQMGERRLRRLLRQHQPTVWTPFPRWLTVENAWMVFPFYVIFVTTVLLILALAYLIFLDEEQGDWNRAEDNHTAGKLQHNDL